LDSDVFILGSGFSAAVSPSMPIVSQLREPLTQLLTAAVSWKKMQPLADADEIGPESHIPAWLSVSCLMKLVPSGMSSSP
jgi:hypothetical protein